MRLSLLFSAARLLLLLVHLTSGFRLILDNLLLLLLLECVIFLLLEAQIAPFLSNQSVAPSSSIPHDQVVAGTALRLGDLLKQLSFDRV